MRTPPLQAKTQNQVHRHQLQICFLQAVKDSEQLRTAVDEVQPERVKLSLRLSQSKPLYEAFKGIKEGKLWSELSEAQQRIVDGELRDFVLGGVALEVSYTLSHTDLLSHTHNLSTCIACVVVHELPYTCITIDQTVYASYGHKIDAVSNLRAMCYTSLHRLFYVSFHVIDGKAYVSD